MHTLLNYIEDYKTLYIYKITPLYICNILKETSLMIELGKQGHKGVMYI